jgi:hypothetical protein
MEPAPRRPRPAPSSRCFRAGETRLQTATAEDPAPARLDQRRPLTCSSRGSATAPTTCSRPNAAGALNRPSTGGPTPSRLYSCTQSHRAGCRLPRPGPRGARTGNGQRDKARAVRLTSTVTINRWSTTVSAVSVVAQNRPRPGRDVGLNRGDEVLHRRLLAARSDMRKRHGGVSPAV